MADLAARRKARLEQSGGQRLEFIARQASAPQAPLSDASAAALASASISPPRRSAFSGSPVFSSSPPAGFSSIANKRAVAPESAVAQATSGSGGVNGSGGGGSGVAGVPGKRATLSPSSLSAAALSMRRHAPLVLAFVLAVSAVLLSLRVPLLLLCAALVFGVLLVAWLLDATTQDTLRSLKGTFQSATTPRMEKLGLAAVLLLQQLGPLREMARTGTDAICVAVVTAVLLKSAIG